MKHRIVSAFGLAIFSVFSYASEDGFLQLLEQENAVFAVSRYVQSLEETPASVSVITRDEMERYGYYSLENALNSLPGIYDASNLAWPMFGIRGVAKPGDICSRFLILINGMPAVYDPVFGGTCFQLIDIESLKKIEFVRGPGSSIYGSGSVLGVINLVTEDEADFHGFRISLKGSTQKEAQMYGSWADKVMGVQGFVSASGKKRIGNDYYFADFDVPNQTNGWSKGNDGQDLYRVFGKFGKENSWLQVRYEKNRKVDPQARWSTVFDTNQLVYDDRSLSTEFVTTTKFGEESEWMLRAYITKFDEYGAYPFYANDPNTGDAVVTQGAVDYIYLDNIDSRQYGFETRFDTFLFGGQHLVTGLDVRYVSGRQYGGVQGDVFDHDFLERYVQMAVYAQDEIPVGISGRLTLGGRLDYYQSYSPDVTWRFNPRVAYIHRLNSDMTAKLLYSEAYRVPTQYELFYEDGSTKFSNLELKPEIVRTLETIFDYTLNTTTKLSSSLYLTRLHDGIVVAVDRYINISGYQQVAGFETSVESKFNNGSTSYLSLTLQRGIQYPEDVAMSSSPNIIAKTGLNYPLPFNRWSTGFEAKFVSESKGLLVDGQRRLSAPAYWLVDWTLASGEIWKEIKITSRVNNVFDHKASTVADTTFDPLQTVPLAGRTASLKLEWSF